MHALCLSAVIFNSTVPRAHLLLSVISASYLQVGLRTIKFCSVVFGVTLRLLVINTSSSVSRGQQMTPFIATNDECHQLATVRRSV